MFIIHTLCIIVPEYVSIQSNYLELIYTIGLSDPERHTMQ